MPRANGWVSVGLCVVWLVGACAQDAPPSTAGNACTADEECGALRCVADADADPQDLDDEPLVCGELSEGREPHVACEQASDCDRGLCLLAGACARACDDASDCDDGERCQDVFARRSDDALTKLRACVNVVDAPEDVGVTRELRQDAIENGDVDVAIDAVDRDATTLGVLEHSDPIGSATTFCRPPLCVLALHAGETSLFDADACDEAPLVSVATGDHIDPIVLRFSAEAAELGADDGFIASLRSEAEGDLELTTLVSTGERRRLDLNLFYVGASDLEATGDRGPRVVADALERVDEIFAQADIFIGEVRQIDVPGALPEVGLAFPNGRQGQGFADLRVHYGVYAELPYLFRLSAGASNAAINVFFVADIQPRTGSEPEAEAGGVPGPLGMHGTAGSGIVIAADMMGGDSEAMGRTLAHEIGHYLGLFHTSEANGCVRDALDDTPVCPDTPDVDVDGDGLDVGDCAELGADNLMFWAKTTGTTLTPEQIGVLRSALVLQ